MVARTHDLAAITALGVVFLSIPQQPLTLSTIIVAVFANLVGGIAPDTDRPTAPFWRNLPVGPFFGKIFGKMLGGHRFLSHSIIGLFVFGFTFYLLLNFFHPVMTTVDIGIVWWAFIIGMVSHLVMDSLTEEGVPWLLPIPVKLGFPPIKRWRIKTGKWFETWIVFPGLLAFNVWFYFQHYGQILEILHNKTI